MSFKGISGKSHSVLARFLVLATVLQGFFVTLAPLPARAELTDGASAIDEIGQYDQSRTDRLVPRFGVNNTNDGASGISRLGFSNPNGVEVDTVHHRLFVADTSGNRVLVFILNADNSLSSKVPNYVLGQPDFNTDERDVTLTQSGMSNPYDLAVDSSHDRLFVLDGSHGRVLVYELSTGISNGMNAAYVLGQPDFTTYNFATDSTTLGSPNALTYDGTNQRLFVTDGYQNRIMVWNLSSGIVSGSAASNILGQPNFTTSTANKGSGFATIGCNVSDGTTNACGLQSPRGLAYDASGSSLFVADVNNSRVLQFDVASITDGEAAVHVLGQTDFSGDSQSTSQTTMTNPISVVYDASGSRLIVADTYNSRILTFSSPIADGDPADKVLGQLNFNTANAPLTQAGMNTPADISLAGTNLYIVDSAFNRVTVQSIASIVDGQDASDVIGQYDAASTNPFSTTVIYTKGGAWNSPNRFTFSNRDSNSLATAFDGTHHRLFVTDGRNARVLVFNLTADNMLTDKMADYVIGQRLRLRRQQRQQHGLRHLHLDEPRRGPANLCG